MVHPEIFKTQKRNYKVHLGTLKTQRRNFEINREQILNSGYRFAVISSNKIKYYNNRETLYEKYPFFNPNIKKPFGMYPQLIDIGKETNSLEYRKEEFEKTKQKYKNDLIKLIKKWDKLEEIEKTTS